jgi:pantothenate kinase-related protein Tda10
MPEKRPQDSSQPQRDASTTNRNQQQPRQQQPQLGKKLFNIPVEVDTTQIEDLLCLPGRVQRPSKFAIFMRGASGSGKSFAAKLIKDKEVENGGNAPRILSLDDYFMAEVEKEVQDPETGRRVKSKVMKLYILPNIICIAIFIKA